MFILKGKRLTPRTKSRRATVEQDRNEAGRLEKQVKSDVKKYLDSLGAYWFMPVPMAFGVRTIDFLCCVRGRFLGVETKATGGHPTQAQKNTMAKIRLAGGLAIAVDNIESLKLFVEANIPWIGKHG